MWKFILKNFLNQYLFFILLFATGRLAYLIIYFKESYKAGIIDCFLSFWYAFPLDNSTVTYLMTIPFLLYFFFSLFPHKSILTILKYYTYLIIIFVLIVLSADIIMYSEWSVKLNYKAVIYLQHPTEVIKSAKPLILISGIIMISLSSFLLIKFVNKFLFNFPQNFEKPKWWFSVSWFIMAPLILFYFMRGGFSGIPITQSRVYFSKSNFINLATVNAGWNLGYSMDNSFKYSDSNPFLFFKTEVAENRFKQLYDFPKNDSIQILKTKRPNIVLIIMESWSGHFVDELGYDLHISPKVSNIIKDGLLFKNTYATGLLSQQGMATILGGWPSTPISIITEDPSKYDKLPCLGKTLNNNGYHTSFHFGGQLEYGNIRAYIVYNKFKEIVEQKDFSSDIPVGALGYHDEFMFKRLLSDINSYPNPFFAACFTLSLHSPFDQPIQNKYPQNKEYNDLFTAVSYADSCLYDFIQQAKKQDWYDNTLFIIVADHGHPSPYKFSYFSKELKHIPLIFYGNVIKEEFRGKTFDEITSQMDIPATLLAQLGLDYSEYRYSRNTLNPHVNRFAYFGYHNGYGWVDKNGNFTWLMDDKRLTDYTFKSTQDSLRIMDNGKAFIETLYQDYIER